MKKEKKSELKETSNFGKCQKVQPTCIQGILEGEKRGREWNEELFEVAMAKNNPNFVKVCI